MFDGIKIGDILAFKGVRAAAVFYDTADESILFLKYPDGWSDTDYELHFGDKDYFHAYGPDWPSPQLWVYSLEHACGTFLSPKQTDVPWVMKQRALFRQWIERNMLLAIGDFGDTATRLMMEEL